ncbi:uncharacterized protein LOC102205829 isoform X2 [Pundamilia nyererei]|uniref:Uncharacterized protein LOC102205829 isoform X2 n=1 Tax=Pundamilia nyererei TaxID=303518 RepID=A0A9Y3VMT0_9CICH|nr:PREDICTED: uncharacterized protein LOC102205829 isoform X2 [Pundamilia nyererei]
MVVSLSAVWELGLDEKLQLHLSLTELQRSDCTVTEAQDETMDGFSPASARCGPRCQHQPQRFRPRPMHQSTLSLGDTPPCYTTTHTQSYSGRSADGRPLVFRLRDPSFPSQHRSQLDLRDNNMPPQSVLQSHSKEVYAPQHVTPRVDPKLENWTRYNSSRAIRELISQHQHHPPECQSTYRTEHPTPEFDGLSLQASGRQTQRHRHDILTGEPTQVFEPGKSSRRSRDQQLWATRRWETDCTAFRLY